MDEKRSIKSYGLAGRGLRPAQSEAFFSLRPRLIRVPSDDPRLLLGCFEECRLEALYLPPGLGRGLAAVAGLAMPFSEAEASLLLRDAQGKPVLAPLSFGALGEGGPSEASPDLGPEPRSASSEQRIILVGPPAVGKSSVGRELALLRRLPFVDCDAAIEAHAGKPISAIFREEGEARFRELESRILASLLEGEACVLATGGGAVLSGENRGLLAAKGRVVWLHATLNLLAERSRAGSRPLLAGANAEEVLARLYRERLALYAEIASILLPCGVSSPRQLAEVIDDEIRLSL